MLYIVEKKSATVNMPMNRYLFVTTEVKKMSIYDYTPLQCCNCDFIPCFSTLQFYHLVLKKQSAIILLAQLKRREKRGGPKLAMSSSFTVFYSCALTP
jgi:hypothetical protein